MKTLIIIVGALCTGVWLLVTVANLMAALRGNK